MGLEDGVLLPPTPPLPSGEALPVAASAGVGVLMGVALPVAALLSLPPSTLLGVGVGEKRAESELESVRSGEEEDVGLPPGRL